MPEQERETGVGLERLTARRDFLAVAKGRRRHSPWFTLQAAPAAGREGLIPRVGLTITKKVGTATERNRMRRRMRAALRLVDASAGRRGHDYVIVVKRDTLKAEFASLRQALEQSIAMVLVERGPGRSDAARPRRDQAPSAMAITSEPTKTSEPASRP